MLVCTVVNILRIVEEAVNKFGILYFVPRHKRLKASLQAKETVIINDQFHSKWKNSSSSSSSSSYGPHS